MYIDKLDDIVDKYNNTYHKTIKVKPINVKLNIYIYIYIYINVENRVSKVIKKKSANCILGVK